MCKREKFRLKTLQTLDNLPDSNAQKVQFLKGKFLKTQDRDYCEVLEELIEQFEEQ